jgi:hypothetical protein
MKLNSYRSGYTQGLKAALEGLLGPVGAGDVEQKSLDLVVLDQGRRAFLIDSQAHAHRFGVVIVALIKASPAQIAYARDLGRQIRDMVGMLAF